MLKVEVDVFSGRPNPEWMITEERLSEELLGAAAEVRGALAKPGAGYTELGYREIRVSNLGDDERRRRGVPQQFAVGTIASEDLAASGELARRFLDTMPKRSKVKLVSHELTPLSASLLDFIRELLERFLSDPPRIEPPPPAPPYNPLRTTVQDAQCKECAYEISQFNPGFWNRPEVMPRNNCYNYARNWRTDTFAQPGRAHGAQTSTMACGPVTKAALADGLKPRCTCLPDSEWPRRMMALVIAPDYDYHWYREQRDGFWGHKPGQTAARNTDSNGAVVVNPETCARGPYTEFCGYFYAGKSVVIN